MSYIKRRITTTLPTTLNVGEEVYYQDANGVLTLWVGRADGSAWPAVGYKEYVALLEQGGTGAPTATIINNQIGSIVWTRANVGQYLGTLSGAFLANKTEFGISNPVGPTDYAGIIINRLSNNALTIDTFNSSDQLADDVLSQVYPNIISIRIYP